jgi:hypothetical protein
MSLPSTTLRPCREQQALHTLMCDIGETVMMLAGQRGPFAPLGICTPTRCTLASAAWSRVNCGCRVREYVTPHTGGQGDVLQLHKGASTLLYVPNNSSYAGLRELTSRVSLSFARYGPWALRRKGLAGRARRAGGAVRVARASAPGRFALDRCCGLSPAGLSPEGRSLRTDQIRNTSCASPSRAASLPPQ